MILYLFVTALSIAIPCAFFLARGKRKKLKDETSRLETIWKGKIPQAIEDYNEIGEKSLRPFSSPGKAEFRVTMSNRAQLVTAGLPSLKKNDVFPAEKNNDQLALFSVPGFKEDVNDISIDFEKKPKQSLNTSMKKKFKKPILQLYVKRESNKSIDGSTLVRTLNKVGLAFGQMDIFHYLDPTQSDPHSIFSAANMHEPGTFDMSRIEILKSNGVVLFMEPIERVRGTKDFFLMLAAAKKLAELLKANLYISPELQWDEKSENFFLAMLDQLNE